MFSSMLMRFFSSNSSLWAAVNKSDLAKLRKKTGYTFVNCKKALEVNNNDLNLAEKWLKEQAQALGWAKASKLEGRATLQGLIGLALKGNTGVMVEVNCETDFVARNKSFKSLVETATKTCLLHAADLPSSQQLVKHSLDSQKLKSLVGPENKSLGDHIAIAIANLGENLSLRRSIVFKANEPMRLSGFTHPTPENISAPVLFGKYGALIAFSASSNDPKVENISRQLCQHVVGMNPSKVGVVGEDEPNENNEDETVMIHQDFLLDPSITIGELLSDTGIQINSFVRLECGEQLNTEEVESEGELSRKAA